jgi:DNA-binding CsgD family transcriptional regulator
VERSRPGNVPGFIWVNANALGASPSAKAFRADAVPPTAPGCERMSQAMADDSRHGAEGQLDLDGEDALPLLAEAKLGVQVCVADLHELIDSWAVPALAEEVERELDRQTGRASGWEMLEPPSEAELAVLGLLASDLSVREIGDQLFLSPYTIRSHTQALYRKLGVHSRAEAVARATALGLLGQTRSPI